MNKVEEAIQALERAAELYNDLPDILKTKRGEWIPESDQRKYFLSTSTLAREAESIRRKITQMQEVLDEVESDDEPLENPTIHNTQPVLVNSRWYDRDGNWEIEVTNVRSHAGMTVVEWVSGSIELDDFLIEFYQPPKYESVWRNKHNGYRVMVSGHEVYNMQLTNIYTLNDVWTPDGFYETFEEVTPEVGEDKSEDVERWWYTELRKRLNAELYRELTGGIPEVGSYWTHKETGRVTKVTDLIYDAYGRPIIFEETSYADGTCQWELNNFYDRFEPNGQ